MRNDYIDIGLMDFWETMSSNPIKDSQAVSKTYRAFEVARRLHYEIRMSVKII